MDWYKISEIAVKLVGQGYDDDIMESILRMLKHGTYKEIDEELIKSLHDKTVLERKRAEEYQKNRAQSKARFLVIMKEHGIRIKIAASDCFESAHVSFEYKGELIIYDYDFNIDMFSDEEE